MGMTNTLEVRPLRGEELSRFAMPWTPLSRARSLRSHIERHPHLAFWVPASGEWVVGGYWRERRDIGVLLRTSGPRQRTILLARLLTQFQEEGCQLAVLGSEEAGTSLGWYKEHGWQLVDRLLILRRGLRGQPPLSGQLPALSLFRPEDLRGLTELDKVAFPWLWWNDPGDFLAYASSPQVRAFLGRLDGRLVAYVSYTLRAGRGHLDRLAVHPAIQGQGYGRGLLSFAMEQMSLAGVREIGLTTQSNNLRAQRLYDSFGFSTTGETCELYGLWLTSHIPSHALDAGDSLQLG
jgi:ribosomal protein S18 acetylase RimI-like enzyme